MRPTSPTRSLTEIPNWIAMKCKRCRGKFWSLPSQAEHTDFCSKECRNETPLVRLMKGVTKKGDCWLFLKSVNKGGYGAIKINGRQVRANRASWELHNGPIPEGLCVLHKCIGTPACINPAHLYLGTIQNNVDDRMNQGRHVAKPGEAHPRAIFKEAEVLVIRKLKGVKTSREVAAIYNCSRSAIHGIWYEYNWRHLKNPVDSPRGTQ